MWFQLPQLHTTCTGSGRLGGWWIDVVSAKNYCGGDCNNRWCFIPIVVCHHFSRWSASAAGMDPGWWCRSLIAPSKFLAGVWSRPRGGKLTYAEPPVAPLLDPELFSTPHLLSSWVQMAAGVCRVALLPCTASIFLLVDNWKMSKHHYTHTSQYTPSDSFKNDCLSLKKKQHALLFQIILTFHIWPFDFFYSLQLPPQHLCPRI